MQQTPKMSKSGSGEEFYSNTSRVGLLTRWVCVPGLHFFNLITGNLVMCFFGSLNPTSGGLLWCRECCYLPPVAFSSIKSSKILLCVSLEAEPVLCPKAALLFLGCSSLVSASLPFPDKQLKDVHGPGAWQVPPQFHWLVFPSVMKNWFCMTMWECIFSVNFIGENLLN